MGTYSSGIDGIFDSMRQASADSSSPRTLRPVSHAAEDTRTQPSIRLLKMNAAEARRLRRKSTRWRLPVLVWSTVLLTALAARGTIVQSVGSLHPRAPKAAAVSVGMPSASSSAPVLAGPSRVVLSARELLRIERDQPAETLPLPAPAPALALAPADAKTRIKPKPFTVRRTKNAAPDQGR